MTIADLIQSTIDSSKERIKTPITGAFICSFLIYNWQPLLILVFSECTIEARIGEVNEYFNPISFLWPFGMALLFTICIPLLMWGLDSINIFAKKKRLGKSFQNRRNLILEKIKIAGDVNELKNAESGNKEKQDFLDEITLLKETIVQKDETINQLSIANSNTTEQLNKNLKSINLLIEETEKKKIDNDLVIEGLEQDLKEARRSTYFARDVSATLRKMTPELANKFMDLKEEKGGRLIFRLTSNRKESFQKFWELKLVEKITEDHYRLTDLGSSVYNILHLNSQLTFSPDDNDKASFDEVRTAHNSLTTQQRSQFKSMVKPNGFVDTSVVSVNEVNDFTDRKLIVGSLDTRDFILTALGFGVLQLISNK